QRACQGNPNEPNVERKQFYNPTMVDTGSDAKTLSIEWTAFPGQLSAGQPADRARWAAADRSRDAQDEYCEWSVERVSGPGSNIRSVTFTCEGPEYWHLLG